jgi:hypothetical protein
MTEHEIRNIVQQIIRADESAMPPLAFTAGRQAEHTAPTPSKLALLLAALPSAFRGDSSDLNAVHYGWATAAGEKVSGAAPRLGLLPALVIDDEGEETVLMADSTQKPRLASRSGKLAVGVRLTAPPFPAGAVYAVSFLAVRAGGNIETINTDHLITVGVEANIGTHIDNPDLQREWRTVAQTPWQDLPLRIVLRKVAERTENTAKAA